MKKKFIQYDSFFLKQEKDKKYFDSMCMNFRMETQVINMML